MAYVCQYKKGCVHIVLNYLDGLLTWPVFIGWLLQVQILFNLRLDNWNLKSEAKSCSNNKQTSLSLFHIFPQGLHIV